MPSHRCCAGYVSHQPSIIKKCRPLAGCYEWWTKRSKQVAMLEFDRIRKSMSVIVREPTGQNQLLVKGLWSYDTSQSFDTKRTYITKKHHTFIPRDGESFLTRGKSKWSS
nr:calcium-transporting ATPase, endoplasmic reticulum-type-like [Quercus suber]